MMMKRNCNLELRLVTPSDHHSSNLSTVDRTARWDLNDEEPKLTIFYNGRIAACDATEFQVREIIMLASGGEVEDEKRKNKLGIKVNSGLRYGIGITATAATAAAASASGLSMKTSLKRFLQKRKGRAQSFSPYPISHHHP